jgi:hypothetical protein
MDRIVLIKPYKAGNQASRIAMEILFTFKSKKIATESLPLEGDANKKAIPHDMALLKQKFLVNIWYYNQVSLKE